MQLTLKAGVAPLHTCAAPLFFAAALALGSAQAAAGDQAYITQAPSGAAPILRASAQLLPGIRFSSGPQPPRSTAFVPTPEAATSARSLNFAQTLEIGRSNQVAQFQAGQSNISNVGVIGGSRNAVGVFQAGNDLSSLYLVNTQGLSVGVLQPKGAPPSNVLIARLPSGALLIKR